MEKVYSRINWENRPSIRTPIDELNLNKTDVAINTIDDRVITLDLTKANQNDLLLAVKSVVLNQTTGVITITQMDNTTTTYDTALEKIAVNFDFQDDPTEPHYNELVLTLEDGSVKYVDLAALVEYCTFTDSDTIAFTDTNHNITAEIKAGSITANHLDTDYRADMLDAYQRTLASAEAALASEQNAAADALLAESHNHGNTGVRDNEDTDNSKYWCEQSESHAEDSEDSKEDAEAWAVGRRNGTPVPSTDPTYHNSSKYWAEIASSVTNVFPMEGATDSTNGKGGLVPQPLAGDNKKALYGDGTWKDVKGRTWLAYIREYGTPFAANWLTLSPTGGVALTPDTEDLYLIKSSGKYYNVAVSWNGTEYEVTSKSAHIIVDEDGVSYPQRDKMKFFNAIIEDDPTNDTTNVYVEGTGSIIVTPPTVTVGTYTYNGQPQGPTIVWATGMEDKCVVTNATKTDAGTYTLTIALKNSNRMIWTDMTTADKTYSYTIAKQSLTVPTVDDTGLVYDGTAQSPTITGFDSDTMTKSGDTETDAGSYTVTFGLVDSDNYQWDSSTTSFAWTIAKATLTVPTVTGSFTYDGTQKSATISGFDSSLMTKSGDTATNAGTYTVTFGLVDEDNYQWNTTPATGSWTIAKANQTITLSSSSVTLDSNNTTATVTVSGNQGSISASSSNTSKATVSVSGTTVTISRVGSSGNATVTVTVTAASTTNYNSVSDTVTVTVKYTNVVSWANGTDAEIVAMVQAADNGDINLSDYWSVGDEREVTLSAMSATGVGESHASQKVTLVLMHRGLYDLKTPTAGGRYKCSFIVGLKNCLAEGGYMNSTDTNSGSWKNSKRRAWCNSVFYNAFPSSIRGIFKQFKTLTASVYNGSTNESTYDHFALPAEKEVFGASTYSNSTEAGALKQFNYYKMSANRVKKLGSSGSAAYWWERSPQRSEVTGFCTVSDSGSAYATIASYAASNPAVGLAPFGCI